MCRAYGDDNTGGRGDSRKDKEMKWESIDREKVGYCGKKLYFAAGRRDRSWLCFRFLKRHLPNSTEKKRCVVNTLYISIISMTDVYRIIRNILNYSHRKRITKRHLFIKYK